MKNSKTEDAVKSIISGITNKKDFDCNNLLDTGILDSLLTMQLIQKLEKKFKVKFSTVDFTHHNFNSISSICALININKK